MDAELASFGKWLALVLAAIVVGGLAWSLMAQRPDPFLWAAAVGFGLLFIVELAQSGTDDSITQIGCAAYLLAVVIGGTMLAVMMR